MEIKRPSLLRALLFLVIVAGVIIWWVTSLANGDPLWFWRQFSAKADWIVIYWDGQTTMIVPGDAHYGEIMDAFSNGVAHWTGYEGGVGLSDENLDRFRTEWRLLELHYNEPVLVHTRHLYPRARNFFIPLSSTHAQYRRVFAGLTDKPRIGVLNLSPAHFEALLETVEHTVGSSPN